MNDDMTRLARLPITYLFVPGNRPERFEKAVAAGADVVIVDLEDAVAPSDKPDARANIGAWCDAHKDQAARIMVRINDETTEWFEENLHVVRSGVGAIQVDGKMVDRPVPLKARTVLARSRVGARPEKSICRT